MLLRHQIEVKGDPDAAFALATDTKVAPRIDGRVLSEEVLGGGPMQAGSVVRKRFALPSGNAVIDQEILELDPEGRVLRTRSAPGLGLRLETTAHFEPHEGGTRITFHSLIEPRHLLGYLGLILFRLGGPARLAESLDIYRVGLDALLQERASEPAPQARVQVQGGPQTSTRCPYCRSEASGAGTVACASCFARHHEACWDEHRQCSACGSTQRYAGLEETEGRAAPRAREKA